MGVYEMLHFLTCSLLASLLIRRIFLRKRLTWLFRFQTILITLPPPPPSPRILSLLLQILNLSLSVKIQRSKTKCKCKVAKCSSTLMFFYRVFQKSVPEPSRAVSSVYLSIEIFLLCFNFITNKNMCTRKYILKNIFE